MKTQITVTNDIASFTKTIPEHNLDVQLSRSPAYPSVDEEAFYKVIFIDSNTGRNHPHIDYTLTFENSDGEYVDGMGGHTVDGLEAAVFAFSEEAAFTPKVAVSVINFVPIAPATVQFDTIVTPEFPPMLAMTMAEALGATLALYMRNRGRFSGHST